MGSSSEVYFEAFALLGGGGPGGAPPLGEVKACCEMMGIDEAEERRRMVLYLRAMAAVQGEMMAEQAQEHQSSKAHRAPARRPRARSRRM